MPDIRLPNDIEAIASQIPVYPRGLAELRARLASLPALSPSGLPGVTLAEFPPDDGTVATSGGTTGGAQGTMTTPDTPGTVPGSVITPNTLPSTALAANLRPPKVVSSLPTLPDPEYPTGTLVYNIGEAPARLYRNDDDLAWGAAIDGAEIVARSITAGQIEVGAIGADELAATIILGSVIKTAEGGRRVEISQAGIDLVGADGTTVLVRIPTNGDAVKVVGEVEASVLESTESATLRGTTALSKGSVTTVEDVVAPPASAPLLTADVGSRVAAAFGTYDYSLAGIAYDSSDSTYYRNAMDAGRDNSYLLQFNASGTLVRAVLSRANIAWPVGVAVTSTHVFQAIHNGRLRKHLKSDLSFVSEAIAFGFSVGSLFYDSSIDRLISVYRETDGGSGWRIGWSYYKPSDLTKDTALGSSGDVNTSGLSVSFDEIPSGGVASDGFYWISTETSDGTPSDVYKFNASTGAYVANQDFGQRNSSDTTGGTQQGVTHNGSVFVGADLDHLEFYTSWDWTIESAKYWVGYTWRDHDAAGLGQHETTLGPRASITMFRRTAMTIQNAPIPTGGVDDPNNVRVYMERGASDPGTGNFKLQVTSSSTSRTLTSFNDAGAADPSTNTFPGGTPAELRSQAEVGAGGWALLGDGTAEFGDVLADGDATIDGMLTAGSLGGGSAAFSLGGEGSATATGRFATWFQIGNLVWVNFSFTLTATGSGTNTVTLSAPAGLPLPARSTGLIGQRGGSGVGPLYGRFSTAGTIDQMRTLDDNAIVQGEDLIDGASYQLSGVYEVA